MENGPGGLKLSELKLPCSHGQEIIFYLYTFAKIKAEQEIREKLLSI
jgi:hypothetical protein